MKSSILKKKESLYQKLKDVRKTLNRFNYINMGGCGISALAMYLYSKKNFGIKPEIFYIYRDRCCHYETNQSFLEHKETEARSPLHALLKYDNKYFDSDEILDRPTKPLKHKITLKLLIKSLRNINDWNDAFNRSDIKIIEEKLDIKFPKGIY